MRWTRPALHSLGVLAVTLTLLEAASWAVLAIRGDAEDVSEGWYVPLGRMPDGTSVVPVQPGYDQVWHKAEFAVRVQTNAQGLREPFQVDEAAVRVAFLGDSFTFGHGVQGDERYSARYAAAAGLPAGSVASFSWLNGFQPEHYEYFLKARPGLRPRAAVIGLYLGNDLGADVSETRYDPQRNLLGLPYRRIGARGAMLSDRSVYVSPLAELLEVSRFARLLVGVVNRTPYRAGILRDGFLGPNEPNEPALDLAQVDLRENRAMRSLVRIRDLVGERGGRLHVVVIPQSFYVGVLDNPHLHASLKPRIAELLVGENLLKAVRRACEDLALACIDTSVLLGADDYYPLDGHWNASGHRKVGEALARLIR
jgi:hypothetical protein